MASDLSERVDRMTARLKAAVSDADIENGSVIYRFPDAPPIRIEWIGGEVSVTNSDTDAEGAVELEVGTLEQMIDGKLDPTRAFTQGRLRLVGELSLAMKMTGLIRSVRS